MRTYSYSLTSEGFLANISAAEIANKVSAIAKADKHCITLNAIADARTFCFDKKLLFSVSLHSTWSQDDLEAVVV